MHAHEAHVSPQLHDRNLSCEWQAWGTPPAVSFGVPTFFPFLLSPPVLYLNVPFDDRRRQRVSVVETVNAMICPVAPKEWKTQSCPGVVSSTWRALFRFFFPLLIPAEEVRIQEVRGRSSVLLLITVIAVIATCPTSTLQRRSHPRGKLSRELEEARKSLKIRSRDHRSSP
jgi:hypothetical protein